MGVHLWSADFLDPQLAAHSTAGEQLVRSVKMGAGVEPPAPWCPAL
jgi:hypothetical protein